MSLGFELGLGARLMNLESFHVVLTCCQIVIIWGHVSGKEAISLNVFSVLESPFCFLPVGIALGLQLFMPRHIGSMAEYLYST